MNTKICSKCQEPQLATTDNFHTSKTSADGFQNYCKMCKVAYNNKQRAKNRASYAQSYKPILHTQHVPTPLLHTATNTNNILQSLQKLLELSS